MNKKIYMRSLKWCGGQFVFFEAIDDYCFDSSKKTLHWTICVISLKHRHSQEDVLSEVAGIYPEKHSFPFATRDLSKYHLRAQSSCK